MSPAGLPAPAAESRPPRAPSLATRTILFALAALFPLLYAAPRTSINPRSLLPDMIEGTAHRPYVKRVLVPWTVRVLDAAFPAGAREALAGAVARSPALSGFLRWTPEHAAWFLLVFLLHAAALVAFGFGMERLARDALGFGARAAAGVAAATVFLVPLHFGYQNFLYDFPALALFAFGLAFLYRRRWGAYYALWPIGLLNKETYVLMLVAFVLVERERRTPADLLQHLAAQAGIAVVVLGALAVLYSHTPGSTVEFHLWRNLAHRPGPSQLRRDLAYWGFALFAIVGGWRLTHIRRPLLGIGAVLLGTTFFLGYLGEYRDFYEAYPLLALLAAGTVERMVRHRAMPAAGAGTGAAGA